MSKQTKGLHEVADGVFAWIAESPTWCYSNAGLVCGADESFLVDTLIDYPLTREMLGAMAPHTASKPIVAALNTHANADHTFGNSLLDASVRIHTTVHTDHELHDVPPGMVRQMLDDDMGPVLNDFLLHCFGDFDFDGIELRNPDVTFEDELTVTVGGRDVRLVELAPAHTLGDAVAFVPDTGVLFGGDLLFIDGTPITWSGAAENWIAACDRMLSWDPQVVIPGHGPITDAHGIVEVRDYLSHILEQTKVAIAAGKPWLEAADTMDLDRFATLGDAERIVISTYQLYRTYEPSTPEASVAELFGHMGDWWAKRR